ncbi:MAG: glycosyltransferase family 4 protein [Armatimonadota bacterium]
MRVAAYHNLMHGGAYRAAMEQFTRLGDCVTDIYTNSDTSCSIAAKVHYYPVKLRRIFHSPFGRLNGLVNIHNLAEMAKSCRQIAADIDAGGYDVVFARICRITQTPALLRFLKTPVVYYADEPFRAMHEALLAGGPHPSYKDPARMLYTRAAVQNEYAALTSANTVLCNSYYTREYMLSTYGVNAKVNYLGIDSALFHPTGQEKQNYVLSVGRLSMLKGHEFIIESLARIDECNRPRLHIVYAPYDPYEAELCAKAEALGVRITFHSDITDDSLVGLYNSAICTVYAPVLEPFGLVPLESMSCGTPVVGICEGGVRETITHGVDGFLAERDPDEFGGYVERLVRDPDLADSMGKAGRESVANNWSWDKSIAQLRSILEDAAGL